MTDERAEGIERAIDDVAGSLIDGLSGRRGDSPSVAEAVSALAEAAKRGLMARHCDGVGDVSLADALDSGLASISESIDRIADALERIASAMSKEQPA